MFDKNMFLLDCPLLKFRGAMNFICFLSLDTVVSGEWCW